MDVKKAYEITDARIQYVSLVDKAANLKKFLITKADDGRAAFTTCGRIVRKDADNHFVTGIVYEPMVEDAHGNFMTEGEITKAAYYFAKSGNKVDLQHSFEPLEGAAVVESWIAKADFQIGDETVKQGTWLMTVEIADNQIWEAIEKGEITGFSMGGVGVYSEEDVQLEDVEKTAGGSEPEQSEKKGVFKKLAALLGFDVVEKGEFQDTFEATKKAREFWAAFDTLEGLLRRWDYYSDTMVFESDTAKITEALSEFSDAIQTVLAGGAAVAKEVAKCKPVEKAGKKMSSANKETLQTAYEALGVLLEAVADPEPDDDGEGEDGKKKTTETKPKDDEGEENSDKEEAEVKKEEIEKLVQDTVAEAVAKAFGEQQPTADPEQQPEAEAVTKEEVQEMVTKAVSEAITPLLKARGVPTAMNDGGAGSEQPVEKHYLHGIL